MRHSSVFVRAKRVGKRTYYQRVESYRDKQGRPRQRVVEHLGTRPPGDDRVLDSLEAALVADEIVKHEPTQEELRRLLGTMDVPVGKWTYDRVGVELDVVKKNAPPSLAVSVGCGPASCLACRSALVVRKTRSKMVHFPGTSIRMREVQRRCRSCNRVLASPYL